MTTPNETPGDGGGTWPEQNAVFDWIEKHGIAVDRIETVELASIVSEYRIEVQKQLATAQRQLAEEKKRREQLESDYRDAGKHISLQVARAERAEALIRKLVADYNHPWPDETDEGRCHRLMMLEDMTTALHQEGGPTYKYGWSYKDADSHNPTSNLKGWRPLPQPPTEEKQK